MIYRDDDIRFGMPFNIFMLAHNKFVLYNKIHTLSLICENINPHEEWVKYVNAHPEEFDIQLHGWIHDTYGLYSQENVELHLEKSMYLINDLFESTPNKWYLPWNGWIKDYGNEKIDWLRPVATKFGLEIDIDCVHITDFLKGKKKETVYFHWWVEKDINNLEELLKYEK